AFPALKLFAHKRRSSPSHQAHFACLPFTRCQSAGDSCALQCGHATVRAALILSRLIFPRGTFALFVVQLCSLSSNEKLRTETEGQVDKDVLHKTGDK